MQWEEWGEEWWNKELKLKEKKWVQGNVLDFPLTPHCQCDKGMFQGVYFFSRIELPKTSDSFRFRQVSLMVIWSRLQNALYLNCQ